MDCEDWLDAADYRREIQQLKEQIRSLGAVPVTDVQSAPPPKEYMDSMRGIASWEPFHKRP